MIKTTNFLSGGKQKFYSFDLENTKASSYLNTDPDNDDIGIYYKTIPNYNKNYICFVQRYYFPAGYGVDRFSDIQRLIPSERGNWVDVYYIKSKRQFSIRLAPNGDLYFKGTDHPPHFPMLFVFPGEHLELIDKEENKG